MKMLIEISTDEINTLTNMSINFSNKQNQYIPIRINDTQKVHIRKKREQLGIKCKRMYWLLGKKHQNILIQQTAPPARY